MTSVQSDRLALVASAAVKVPVRVATTANITLSGEQTIDGVAVVADDRVLVKSQTDGTENGIYVADTGEWTRALDFNGSYDVVFGTIVYATSGSATTGFWQCTTANPITIGTSSLSFALASGSLATVSAFVLTLLNDADADAFMQTIIATLTAETAPAADDVIVIGDTSASSVGNKITFENFFKVINAITALSAAAATDDELAIYDLSAGAGKKITIANLLLSITSLTAETTLATGDELLINDISDGAANKITVANFLKIINALTADTAPDVAADYIPSYDASAGDVKKVLHGNIGAMRKLTSGASAAVATLDLVLTSYTGYKTLMLELTQVTVSVDDSELRARTSTDGGVSYDAGASDYGYAVQGLAVGAAANNVDIADSEIAIAGGSGAGRGMGSGAGENGSMTIILNNFSDTTVNKTLHYFGGFFDAAATTEPSSFVGQGHRLSTGDVDAFRVLPESGTITIVQYALYALA